MWKNHTLLNGTLHCNQAIYTTQKNHTLLIGTSQLLALRVRYLEKVPLPFYSRAVAQA